MSDTESTDSTSVDTSTASESESTERREAEQLGEGGKKALDAERKRANAAEKASKALQTRLDEIEASKLSDLEKAQKAASEAQAEAQLARGEALRYRIAAKHQISDEDAELFLTATDEETLTRQAERLAERTKASSDDSRSSNGLFVPGEGQSSNATPLNSSALEDAVKRKLGMS